MNTKITHLVGIIYASTMIGMYDNSLESLKVAINTALRAKDSAVAERALQEYINKGGASNDDYINLVRKQIKELSVPTPASTIRNIKRAKKAERALRSIIQENGNGWKIFESKLLGIPDDRYAAWKNALSDNLCAYIKVIKAYDGLAKKSQEILNQLERYEKPWIALKYAVAKAKEENNHEILQEALNHYDEDYAAGYLRATVVNNAKKYRDALKAMQSTISGYS